MAEGTKRYNLAIPQELFDQLQSYADKQGDTVVGVLRRFIKLGLLVASYEDKPDAAVLIRESGIEKQILFY